MTLQFKEEKVSGLPFNICAYYARTPNGLIWCFVQMPPEEGQIGSEKLILHFTCEPERPADFDDEEIVKAIWATNPNNPNS